MKRVSVPTVLPNTVIIDERVVSFLA